MLAVNKAEGLDADIACSEFHALGVGEPVAISAAHGDWISALMDEVLAPFVEDQTEEPENETTEIDSTKPLRIAVIGRPNVGKSTLINRMIGEDRLVVFDQPGTTRDSVAVPFERDNKNYLLVDTAGVRRKARVHEVVEKFSVIKALQAMERSQVVIAVLDDKAHQADILFGHSFLCVEHCDYNLRSLHRLQSLRHMETGSLL